MPRPTSSPIARNPNIPAADVLFSEHRDDEQAPGNGEHRRLRELFDVDFDPDREEEDRDEEVADRLELTTDAVGRRAATESEAGDERTHDGCELRNLGELRDRKCERVQRRKRDQCARGNSEAGNPLEQPRERIGCPRPR